MDPSLIQIAAAAAAVLLLVVISALIGAVINNERTSAEARRQMIRLEEMASRLAEAQAHLAGRLEQQQAGVNTRLDALGQRLGDGLAQHTEKTGATLRALHERLAVMDAAQRTITDLSGQMVELQHVLSNKQARGAFGEVQLHDLVANVLPPSAFTLQATLSNGNRADCLLKLPDPPGAIVVDAKFPLESYTALRHARDEAARIQAGRAFSAAVAKHVRDIEERYIVPGETADSALMFLPSEAVYAELHANFRAAVEDSFRRRVWIVSPTTLWATLNTVRSILKDVRLREQAGLLQAEMQALHDELGRLDERAGRLQRHLEQGIDDVRQVRRLAGRLSARSARIEKADFTESVDRSDDAGERSGDGAAKHAPGGSG